MEKEKYPQAKLESDKKEKMPQLRRRHYKTGYRKVKTHELFLPEVPN